MASTYLQRTMGTATNRNIFTLSMWVKLSKLGSDLNDYQFCDFYVSGSIRISLYHNDDDTLRCHMEGGGSYTNNLFTTTAKLRDTNAWYHLVWRFDTTQSSASDRVRVYINGELATFSDYNAPAQDFNLQQGTSSYTQYIGRYGGNTNNNFDGVMSHIHFCDGYSYDASAFGSTDSTTGEWKINTAPSVTYGNNGFFILKDGNSVTDQSGEGNNFTVGGGTLTKTEDNPSNVFATLNPLVNNAGENMRLTNGNTSCQSNAAEGNSWKLAVSTLGMTSGKYYWEIKFDNVHNCYNNGVMGSNVLTLNAQNPMNQTGYTGFYNVDGGEIKKDGSDTTADYGTYSTGDIMGVACDMDNHTITFYKNGSALVSNVSLSTTGRDVVFPCSVFYNTNDTSIPQASYNFGNGYFGTTAVSSAGTNASGNGIFEYDVPTGYTALSTKGLNL